MLVSEEAFYRQNASVGCMALLPALSQGSHAVLYTTANVTDTLVRPVPPSSAGVRRHHHPTPTPDQPLGMKKSTFLLDDISL